VDTENICLTDQRSLRVEYLFSPAARFGGAKGTISYSSTLAATSTGSSQPRQQMSLTECRSLNLDKTQIVTTH